MTILTVKDYMNMFGISEPTASKYLKDDLLTLGRKRITNVQFQLLYGQLEPIKTKQIQK